MAEKKAKRNADALALHAKLATINITEIPVMSRDRSICRKEQARLARELFKKIGLKGISVTAPNYSMAQSVDVRPPQRNDYTVDSFGRIDYANDPAGKANREADNRLRSILLAAFPSHEDRSDSQSDYFDYCWSL